MGILFSRKGRTNSSRQSAYQRNSMTDETLLRENKDFIADLLNCGEFLDRLESILRGDVPVPADFANQTQNLDYNTIKSFIEPLSIKEQQLKNIKLLLSERPNIPNADLLLQLLNQIEPKCNAMRKQLANRTALAAPKGNRNANAATNAEPSNIQPGPSSAHNSCQPSTSGTFVNKRLTLQTAIQSSQYTPITPQMPDPGTAHCSSGPGTLHSSSQPNTSGTCVNEYLTSQATAGESSRNTPFTPQSLSRASSSATSRSSTAPPSVSSQQHPVAGASRTRLQPMSVEESRGTALIFSQSDNSSSGASADEDSSDEGSNNLSRKSHPNANLKSLEDWRNGNLNLKPKRITVDRSNILNSVLPLYAAMPTKTLQRITAVTFQEEDGDDTGGLTREFFFIVFEAVISSTYKGQKLMVGSRGHLIPNSMVDCRVFYNLGRLIVHSVINGSRGFCGLSPAIVQYLISDTNPTNLEDSHPPLSVEDVDDFQLKQLLEKYENGDDFTDSELESWMNWMSESNCSVPWEPRESRSYVIQHVLLHFVFLKRLRQIQSLEEGLKSLGLKQFLIENPSDDNISQLFPSGVNLAYTVDSVLQVINTRGNDFNDVTFDFFRQLLNDLYNQGIDEFRLPDLIQFVTSSPYFPERIVVSFDDNIALPEAHACYCEIKLPTRHKSYPAFVEAMLRSLQNGLTGFQLQ